MDKELELWECDGCGYVGTEAEVEAHVLANGTWQNGDLKDPEDIVCWGAMAVGADAWLMYHLEGKHPMDAIRDQIAADLKRFQPLESNRVLGKTPVPFCPRRGSTWWHHP